jgi:hypothetical protein
MNLKAATVLITPASGGKDYFLEILQKELGEKGEKTKNIKFATVTRKITQKILLSKLEKEKKIKKEEIKKLSKKELDDFFDNYKNKKTEYKIWKGKNTRETLQYIAETLKQIDKDINIAFAFQDIIEAKDNSIPIVTDCRFENEMKAMLKYNNAINKEEYIRKFISNLTLPNQKELKNLLNDLFEIDETSKKEDIKIIKLIEEAIKELYKYKTYKQSKIQEVELDIRKMTKEDFLEKNIIILTRYITPNDEEQQKEQYIKHNIDYNDDKYKISETKQRFLGSAHPEHIAEKLAFEMPIGFLNATNSKNLKENLLPIITKKIVNKNTKVLKNNQRNNKI